MSLGIIPDKISFFLHHAKRALDTCSKDDEYIIDFNYWHELHDTPLRSGCRVNLAGAYLAVEYEIPADHDVFYVNNSFNLHVSEWESKKLIELDTIGMGYFEHVYDVKKLFPDHYTKIMSCADDMKILAMYFRTSFRPSYLLKEYLFELNTLAEIMFIYDNT